MTLINFHLPQGETIPSSVYLLSKKLNPCYDQAKKIPFCSNCQNILETNGSCASCQESGRNATKDGNFFVSFDIATIMKQLLERKNIAQCLKKNFAKRQFNNNESSGIMDGEAYKKLKLSKFDITCCINTDGVSIFNSSKSCIWPLLLSINELDYDLRRKHTILAGLWFNDSKPNFKLFLDPLINQSNQLSKEGIQWNFNGVEIKSKIFFPMLAADSVARAPLQGINQFNGEYSCPWCQAKGLNLSTGDRSHKWIFPPTEIAANRNKEHFFNQLLELRDLLSTGSSISNRYGIKLASPLLKIPHFSIVDGFVFDYMHTVLLGVVRMLTFAWILPKNHQEIFYIGNKENQINQKLRRCKIPKNCSRTIRDLSSIKYWKAHEWKNWMLIAVPLLKGILQDCFLKHFAKLVDSISILCQDSVTMDEILVAEILIKEFSMLIPNLYGQSYCSFNVHLLTHAAENVRKWGPLWGYSLFQFENYNGILKNSFCGTREISTQIVNRAICTQKVYSLGEVEFLSEGAKQFHESLLECKRFFKNSYSIDNCRLLGSKKLYIFSTSEKAKLKIIGHQHSEGFSFKSCILYKKLFVNVCSSDTKQHVNSVVKINGKLFVIFKIIILSGVSNALVFVKRCSTIDYSNSPKSFKINYVSNNVQIYLPSDIENFKFIGQHDNQGSLSIATQLMNTVEFE